MMHSHTTFQDRIEQMLGPADIRVVSRPDIDTHRWNQCLSQSPNESPLAYSWVLDHLSPGWLGLTVNGYQGVMPLPATRQAGLPILQMPYEVLTLGLFSPVKQIREMFPAILFHPLMQHFRFVSYNGSPGVVINAELPGTTEKYTYLLNLNKPLSALERGFSRSHRRAIHKFGETGLHISTRPHPGAFTQLLQEAQRSKPELYMPNDYMKRFEAMTAEALNRGRGTTLTVWKDNKPAGAAFFLMGTRRAVAYHLTGHEGKKMRVSFALIAHFIGHYAGTEMELDFAGSMIPNVADFNRRFGALPVKYPSVTINKLPLFWQIAKKMRLRHHFRRLFLQKSDIQQQ